MKRLRRATTAAAAVALSVTGALSQAQVEDGSDLWRDVPVDAATARRDAAAAGRLLVGPGRTLRLDFTRFRSLLARAPMEDTPGAENAATELALPLPEGGFGRFEIEESPIMEPGLAARFPEIRTFRGRGIDDDAASVRLDWTAEGLHAMVLSSQRTLFIDPQTTGDLADYVVYDKKSYRRAQPVSFRCLTSGQEVTDASLRQELESEFGSAPLASFGADLRTYRLALAADGEYTAFFGGASAAMSAMAVAVNRVNAIYEREVAVHLNLVANDNLLVFTDPATDPYTNDDGVAMLAQNQATIDSIITPGGYDIGHVFSTGGGGVAKVASACAAGQKAQGVTGLLSPVGDPFYVDYVAHEMGHQFGANHSFNATTGACGAANQRSATAAYEPGSGSTIMGYAGICASENVQALADDYFHAISLQEINAFLDNDPACSVRSGANTPPTVSAPGGYFIPTRTPFTLTATNVGDVDGDSVTLDWEQFNPAGANAAPPDGDGDGKLRPMFRSLPPATSTSRTFPRLLYILSGDNAGPYETLPTRAHTDSQALKFIVTVRDNHAGVGGTNSALTAVNVVGTAGPFAVTQPNTSAVVWPSGSTQTVAWSVANTSVSPIATANVKISLSTDGGSTFPILLAASAPNTGAASVLVPNVSTTQARVKVEALGNVYFDVSNANFAIKPGLSVNDAPPVVEGNSGTVNASFTVALLQTSSQTVAVHYATADGTARAAAGDYVPRSGDLTFAPGDLTKTVTVAVNGDTLFELDETFFLDLSNPTNAAVARGQGVATITNDDAPPSLSIGDAPPIPEGNSGTRNATFTVSVTPVSGAPATVAYATSDGTALVSNNDYTPLTGTLTIPAGQALGTIGIPVKGDAVIEPDETFFVTLSSPTNATVLDNQGIGTILNDDTPGHFLFSSANYGVGEGAGVGHHHGEARGRQSSRRDGSVRHLRRHGHGGREPGLHPSRHGNLGLRGQ